MTELLPIALFSCIMALLSHKFSIYDFRQNEYVRYERLLYVIMSVAMILFCGLRSFYNDTGTYRQMYEALPGTGPIFQHINWDIGENPGFWIVNRTLAALGFSSQSFILFYAVITVGIYLWFIRKYSCNIGLSIFLMFTLGIYTFTLAAIKQCMAIALSLLAVDRALQKKWIPFVLWVLLAVTFHPYALMYLLVPFLMFRPWSGRTYLLLAGFAMTGVVLEPLLGTVVNITSMIGEEYNAATFSGEGVNIFRVAVCNVPLVLSFITRRQINYQDNPNDNLMVNLSMLNGEIMFVGLFGTALYFARLANYFLIFQAISIPWLLTHFETKSKRFLTIAAIICYFIFFYYQNAINQPFDHNYAGISLFEYLKSVL